jgi:hypothetical protein
MRCQAGPTIDCQASAWVTVSCHENLPCRFKGDGDAPVPAAHFVVGEFRIVGAWDE